jgi:uncharacterized membrane protein
VAISRQLLLEDKSHIPDNKPWDTWDTTVTKTNNALWNSMLENLFNFKRLMVYLAVGIEASAALLIGLATIEATVRAIELFFYNRNSSEDFKEIVRLRFGTWLALSLEFELAADIVRTTISRTWTELGNLGIIIILRTTLNFFLQKEIERVVKRNYKLVNSRQMINK